MHRSSSTGSCRACPLSPTSERSRQNICAELRSLQSALLENSRALCVYFCRSAQTSVDLCQYIEMAFMVTFQVNTTKQEAASSAASCLFTYSTLKLNQFGTKLCQSPIVGLLLLTICATDLQAVHILHLYQKSVPGLG